MVEVGRLRSKFDCSYLDEERQWRYLLEQSIKKMVMVVMMRDKIPVEGIKVWMSMVSLGNNGVAWARW